MKRIISLLLLSALFLGACNILSEKDTEVSIRVKNNSNFQIDNMRISTGGGDHTYDTIPSGGTSEYADFDYSYSYFLVSMKVDSIAMGIQPIDYVGESKIDGGNYTYEISVETQEEVPIYFTGELRKD